MSRSNNKSFSTKDRDNDNDSRHCAVERRGGWWHPGCTDANLNGPYYTSKQKGNYKVIYWWYWKNNAHSLKRVDMKIKLN